MTPAVAPGAEVGWAAAAVGSEGGGDFGETEAGERGFDDHLAGELHASGAEIEGEHCVSSKGSDAAVKVAHGYAKEEAADETKHRVTEVFVEGRHGSGLDLAAEAVAHDEIVALFELL